MPALLATTLAPYPSWLAESPPMSLALPLAFALDAIAFEPMPLPRLALLSGVVALDFALTKGFGIVLLAALVATAFLRDHARALSRGALVALGAGLAVLGTVAVAAFALTSGWLAEVFDVKFLPADALSGLADQLDGRDTQKAGPAFELAGLVLLGVVLLRARVTPLLIGYAVMLAGHWIVGGHGFDILVGLSIVLAALHLRARPDVLLAQRAPALAAALLLIVAAWFRDVTGIRGSMGLRGSKTAGLT